MRQKTTQRWVSILFITGLTVTLLTSFTLMADDSSSTPWVAPNRASRKKNPVPATPDSIAAGKQVYIAQCVKCHGDAGKGDGPSASSLTPRPRDLSDPAVASQTDGALFWKITTGRKPMPTFENLISEDDRWNVVNYIRTFAPAPTSQPAAGN
jgi:mono/diheme cytochrome c family protein